MAGRLFGSAASGNAAPPAIAGFKVQTAVYGLPIPIVYGQARVAGNLIHMYPSTATPQLSQGSRNKFVKIDQQVTGYLYQAPIAIALAEGPIVGIAKVWRDKDAGVLFSVYQAAGWSLFLGTSTQSPWSYLTSNHPGDAFPYQLTAYVAHPLLELPNDVLSNYTFEVQGLAQFGGGIVDANPAAVLTDVLTNADHGVAFPAAQLAALTSYQAYCTAAGLFLSPVLSAQSGLHDQLTTLAEATNSAFVWSDGQLKVLPYADQAITGNGVTYTPNVTPIYDLTDDDFLAPMGTDPIVITRKKPSDCFNQITVEFEDRAHDYNPGVQEAKDQASIDAYGLRPAPALRFPAIKDAATARYIAQLRLQRELAIRNSYAFTLPTRYALLEPMDLVTLTDPGLGLAKTTVRIVEVVETASGDLQMIGEDFPLGVASASRYGAPGAAGVTNANNTPPGATTAPVIFEGPGPLLSAGLEIWMAASGGANWGGCDVHLSTDNVTYTKVGSITRKGNYGVLTTALATAPTSPPNDTTHTLGVDLSASGGSLAAGSATDLAALVTLSLVEGEFLAYQGASLTSANHYSLTTLARGLFGSAIPTSHAIGAPFVRCDGALLKLPFPQGANGQVVYFKFPAFNIFGLGLEDVSTVTAYSHTIGRNTVTTGGAGIVNGPTATITRTAAIPASETLALAGQLGSGGIGALAWSYQIGAATPVTGTGGLPLSVTVTRDFYYDTTVVFTVTQSDGQSITVDYNVAARFPGIDPGTGKVDPAVSLAGTTGTPVHTQHSVGVLTDGPTVQDGATRARGGLDASGYVALNVPLVKAVANVPAISGTSGKLLPGVALDGTTGLPVHTASTLVGNLRTDGNIAATMRQVDGTQQRQLVRGIQRIFARDGDAITFSPPFASTPALQFDVTNAVTAATAGTFLTTAPYGPSIDIPGCTGSGGVLRAKLRQVGGTTPNYADFPAGNNLVAASTATASAALAAAPSSSGHYTVHYKGSVTATALIGRAVQYDVVVVVNRLAAGNPAAPTELSRITYSASDPDGTGPYTTTIDETLDLIFSGMGTTDTLEVRVVSAIKTGSGTASFSVHGINPTDDGAGVHGLTYYTGAADVTTSMTPDISHKVLVIASGYQ